MDSNNFEDYKEMAKVHELLVYNEFIRRNSCFSGDDIPCNVKLNAWDNNGKII